MQHSTETRRQRLTTAPDADDSAPSPAQRPDPDPLTPAQRIADACELARALGLAPVEVQFDHLDQIARSAYARAAVWYGEDAEGLANDAHRLFEEEWNAYYDEDEDKEEQSAPPEARAEFVHRARQQLGRSGRPATEPADVHEAESVRSLYVDILASTMHAIVWIVGDAYPIFHAHVVFMGLHQPMPGRCRPDAAGPVRGPGTATEGTCP